jgi:hypothetical protein
MQGVRSSNLLTSTNVMADHYSYYELKMAQHFVFEMVAFSDATVEMVGRLDYSNAPNCNLSELATIDFIRFRPREKFSTPLERHQHVDLPTIPAMHRDSGSPVASEDHHCTFFVVEKEPRHEQARFVILRSVPTFSTRNFTLWSSSPCEMRARRNCRVPLVAFRAPCISTTTSK